MEQMSKYKSSGVVLIMQSLHYVVLQRHTGRYGKKALAAF